ncbi:hypothetical protein CGLO_06239 [Colletotrichum gloeosporioides Cg-14]|uniref:Uncharacterized protein n=1 Tax=Colletotrichum gloeosporioides (strain Cg-14) TaxID=1237896 RepID=T0KN96_COLGC|nr:hypothetical protein CGLO_06239 [Colletotrichum gloeosporioides Cg-14]
MRRSILFATLFGAAAVAGTGLERRQNDQILPPGSEFILAIVGGIGGTSSSASSSISAASFRFLVSYLVFIGAVDRDEHPVFLKPVLFVPLIFIPIIFTSLISHIFILIIFTSLISLVFIYNCYLNFIFLIYIVFIPIIFIFLISIVFIYNYYFNLIFLIYITFIPVIFIFLVCLILVINCYFNLIFLIFLVFYISSSTSSSSSSSSLSSSSSSSSSSLISSSSTITTTSSSTSSSSSSSTSPAFTGCNFNIKPAVRLQNPTKLVFNNYDTGFATINVPFSVGLYGTTDTTIYVHINGLISLFTTTTDNQARAVPNTGGNIPPISILPYNADLRIPDINEWGVYFLVRPSTRFTGRELVVEYIVSSDGTDYIHFSVTFYEASTGRSRFEYYQSRLKGSDASVGIQNRQISPQRSAQWSYLGAFTQNNFFVEYNAPNSVGDSLSTGQVSNPANSC